MNGLGYQLAATATASAFSFDVDEASPFAKTSVSTLSAEYLATTCNAPHSPLDGSKLCLGRTPRSEVASPVSTNDPVTFQPWLPISNVDPARPTSCGERMYSANPPNDL